jgi:ribokinase
MRQLTKLPDVFFTFQPGTTHVRSGLAAINKLIARSDLFVLNKDEAHMLLGDGERPIRNMLEGFRHLGARTVIITDGAKGADAFDGHTHWHMPIFPGTPVERTGAGDAFASAVTAALLSDEPLSEALRWGAADSWSVIMFVGPQTGLLHATELRRVLKRFKHIQPLVMTLPTP